MKKVSEEFEPINQSATIVVTNYIYANRNSFMNDLRRQNIIDRYTVEEKRDYESSKIGEERVNVTHNLPPEIIELLPQEYTTKCGINFKLLPAPEFKLTITTKKLTEEAFEDFSNITNDLLDKKFTDIEAFGLNFSAEFKLGEIKLQLLNKDVENISDFKRNLTFEFVLPLDYKDQDGCIATYRIRKSRGGDESKDDRYYEVNVNFHFDLQELSTKAKIEKIEKFKFNEYYKKFLLTSQEFLALNNG